MQTLSADVRSKYQTEKCNSSSSSSSSGASAVTGGAVQSVDNDPNAVLDWEVLRTDIVISIPFDTMIIYYIWKTSTNVMCIVNISLNYDL
jgi:hypothetical protein